MTAAAPPLLLPPPSSRPCNQITLLQQQRLLIAIPLMSPHIASLHVCVTYIYTRGKKETRAPPRQRVWSAIQSRLCSRPLHQNLAFMLDSAAPHAIRKSDIIDQSSNSRLFQQTEREKKKKRKKKNRFKLSCTEQRCGRQLCVHLLSVLTAILSNWWGSSLVTAGLRYKKVE